MRLLLNEKYIPWLLAIFFALAILPTINTLAVFHSDERHYSEAALRMNNSGDYLTPVDINGLPRLKKPVLTYWFVALSYMLFGISPFAMRFPSVIAGAMTIYFTYKLGRDISGKTRVGVLAALISMSNIQFILAAGRANPDMLLCLFMAMGFYGFVNLLILNKTDRKYYWYAYLGAALAIATKGMLGVVFIGYVWLFCLFDKKISIKRVLNYPALLTGIIVAGWWYVAMHFIHGGDSLNSFWHDQLGRRLPETFFAVIAGILYFACQEFVFLFPWSFVAVEAYWKEKNSCNNKFDFLQEFSRFTLPWIMLGVIIFGFQATVRIRYMVPFIPMLSAWLAMRIAGAEYETKLRAVWHQLIAISFLLLFFALLILFVHVELGRYFVSILIIISSIILYGTISFINKRRDCLYSAIVLGCTLLIIVPASYLIFMPFILPEPTVQIDRYLQSHNVAEKTVYCVTSRNFFEKLRLVNDEESMKLKLQDKHKKLTIPENAVLIVSDERLPEFKEKIPDYKWEKVSDRIGRIKAGVVLKAVVSGRLNICLDKHREHFFVGFPSV